MIYLLDSERSREESSRIWRLSLTVSLAVHLLFLAGITGWGLSRTFEFHIPHTAAAAMPEMTYTDIPVGRAGSDGENIVDNIVGSIPGRLEKAGKLTPSERAAVIKQGVKDLEKVRESSLYEISELFNVRNRAYEPVDPPPPGPFDIDSQIPYSMRMTETGGYTMVLVDRDGRTIEAVFTAEEVTEDLNAAYEIFKMMDEMPALRKIYMRMTAEYFLPSLRGED